MSHARWKTKGRAESGSFIIVTTNILESTEYAALTPRAVKLLFDLFSQYNGRNNGDFTAAWKVMRKRGWKSKAMLYRTLHELLDASWIILTRRGGKAQLSAHRICSLYGVTWKAVDPCDGKIEIEPTRVPSNAWRNKTATPRADHIGPHVKANPESKPMILAHTSGPSSAVSPIRLAHTSRLLLDIPNEVVGAGGEVRVVPPEPEDGDPGPWQAWEATA